MKKKSALKIKDNLKAAKFEAFKMFNEKIIRQWLSEKKTDPPIYYDEDLEHFRWLSRQERKKINLK